MVDIRPLRVGTRGLHMTLDTPVFLIVLAAALAVVGLVIGLKFRSEKKKHPM
jgi:hypothetical protein